MPWGRGDRKEEVRTPAVRAEGVSSKACGSPKEQRWSLYPDSFPRGFLEEAAAELNFEGLELTWGVRRERAGALWLILGLRPAQNLHAAGRGGCARLLGHLPRAQRSEQLPEGEKDGVPGPTSG